MAAKHRIASFTIETLQPRGLRLRLLLRISFLVHARKYTAGFGISPSTRQVSTSAGEFFAPTQTRRLGSQGSLGNKALAVVTAGTQEPNWLKRQDKLATLSSNSVHRVVK